MNSELPPPSTRRAPERPTDGWYRHDIRIGLEDVTTLPDGRRAVDNAALVVEAVLRYR